MVGTSTANQAAKKGGAKAVVVSPIVNDIQKMAQITRAMLDQHFPVLRTAPNIFYISMMIWGQESDWKMFHERGDSRHNSPSPPNSGFSGSDKYYNCPVIANLRRSNSDPVIANNISHGWVPHALSACMGYYHVIGTPHYDGMFKPRESLVKSFGLAVKPGESITAIYPNTELGWTRSIVAGLIVLDNKYQAGLNSSKIKTPTASIEYAVGAYVGKGADISGMTPEKRRADVGYALSKRALTLKQAGVQSGMVKAEPLTEEILAAIRKHTPPSNTAKNTSNTPPGPSGTPSEPVDLAGCSKLTKTETTQAQPT